MSKGITDKEIVKRFVESKAVDFKAIGNLVAELGPQLVVANLGYRMIVFCRPCMNICIPPDSRLVEVVGELAKTGFANANLGSALKE